MHLNQSDNYNRGLHFIALLTAAYIFPLIFVGGLVTSHGAGMSVPDWPNSYGYNMFAFPIHDWVGGIFYEHTHRLAASGIGVVIIILVLWAWMTDKRPVIRWTAVALLGGVIFQGILGGLRVVLDRYQVKWDLLIAHACTAHLFFCLAATFCVMTSSLWNKKFQWNAAQRQSLGRVYKLGALAAIVIFAQLLVGAIMRHNNAGLAIPDFPTAFGHWLPPASLTPEFRNQAIHQFGPDLGLNRVTLFQIWICFAHRIGAVLVTLAILTLTTAIFLRHRDNSPLTTPAIILLILLVTQITLGILTVLMRKPADIASLHVAVGALVLMTTWVIFMRTYAMLRHTTHESFSPEIQPVKHHPWPGDLQNNPVVQ